MTAPTGYALKFKGGATAPQIYALLNGTTLGAQIGSVFGALETNQTARVQNRVIEAFGKVFVLQAGSIHEKDEGGLGNWGVVLTPLGVSGLQYLYTSGWFMLHPGGRPCLAAFLLQPPTNPFYYYPFVVHTFDGVNWIVTNFGTNFGNVYAIGGAIAYRDSLFWSTGSNHAPAGGVAEYNFQTQAYIGHNPGLAVSRDRDFCVVDNMLCSINPAGVNNLFYLYRLIGSTFVVSIHLSAQSSGETLSGSVCFPDGRDIICFLSVSDGVSKYGTAGRRIKNAATSPSYIDITDPVIPAALRWAAVGPRGQCYEVLTDNNSNPGVPPTIYIWYSPGNQMVSPQSRTCYQFQYRAITHDAPVGGPFVAGETVLGGSSGATGVVHTVGSGQLHLTDVSTTLFTSGETLTGQTSGAVANSTSVLADQPMLLIGGSLDVDFAIAGLVRDSAGPYIPTYPAVRIELGITGVLLTHGSVTNGPFALGETITGAGGAAGILMVDNTGTLVVYPTNATAFINGEVITGSASGASATLSSGPLLNQSIPPHEVIGGRKHYFRVYGSAPDPCTAALYIGMGELSPWERQTILSVALEVGAPPVVTPTVFEGAIINLPADDGARVWSLVWDADPAIIPAGTVYELAMNGT